MNSNLTNAKAARTEVINVPSVDKPATNIVLKKYLSKGACSSANLKFSHWNVFGNNVGGILVASWNVIKLANII